jgi:hypothetical protein
MKPSLFVAASRTALAVLGWPKDALVRQFSQADRAALPLDEPAPMCGPYGRDEDAATFWRIFGG